jgi:hypothetical protein
MISEDIEAHVPVAFTQLTEVGHNAGLIVDGPSKIAL